MDNLEELIKRIEADGKITKAEIRELNAALVADNQLSNEGKLILDRLLAKLRRGEVKEV